MKESNILKILKSKSSVLTFKEIFLATGEKSPDLLKRRLNYYSKNKSLYRIRRGIYAKDKSYDRLELATKIFTPSYISFETVLYKTGVIFQYYQTIFVATYQTREITCDNQTYSFRKIKDTILTNKAGIDNMGNYFSASKERAFLDVLYLNKDYHFDNLSSLDIKKIKTLLPIYNNKRMNKLVEIYLAKNRSP